MKLAKRHHHIADPTVLKLLKLTENPQIISFSGGTPAPNTFATDLVKEAVDSFDSNLQYSPAPGTKFMRETMANWLSKRWNTPLTPDHILITTGSQQALDLVARTYIDPSDTIMLEDPTYFVALYAFNAYQPRYQIINIGELDKPEQSAKLMYLIPTFNNPTGDTLNKNQREIVADYATTNNLIIVEDDPYSELYFEGKPPLPIYTHAPKNTIYITSVSKTIGPALRLGIVVAQPEIIHQLSLTKTGMDLCTSGWLQQIASHIFNHPQLETHLATTRKYYAVQAKHILQTLQTHMPDSVTWTHPQGGLFIWTTLPESIDTSQLYQQAIANNVAFVPGYIFSPNQKSSNSLRLTFAAASPDKITTGIKSLATVINQALLQ